MELPVTLSYSELSDLPSLEDLEARCTAHQLVREVQTEPVQCTNVD